MADIAIEMKVDLLIKENEKVERENALLESYLERVTPNYSIAELPPEPAPTHKKKGKDKQRAMPTSVSLEQKTEIAQQEVEELKEEIERTKDESEKLQDRLRAVMEECDMRIAQVTKDLFEFRREVIIGGENPRTNKVVAEKVVRYFEEKLRSKESTIEKLKLKNTALKNQIQKLDKQLGEKEDMGDVLHVIDFDQLKIENQQYIEKIKERNKELAMLKQTASKTVQVLNSLKGKLNSLTSQSTALDSQTAEKEAALAQIKEEIRQVQAEKEQAEKVNRRYKKKQTEMRMPQVMDYVHRRVEEEEMLRQVESWERKLEIAKRGAAQARRRTAQLQSQGGIELLPSQ
eukprot:SAG11_NODE_2930_length_2830_cov_3.756866_1_plen_346_part_00